MKKLLSVLTVIAVTSNLFFANCYAAENDLVAPTSALEVGIEATNDRHLFWVDSNSIVSTGAICQDGTLSVSWFYPDSEEKTIYETVVLADVVNTLPTIEDGIIDLHYVINNADTLGLDITVLPEETQDSDLPEETQDSDLPELYAVSLKENAVRACINNVYSTSTYSNREIAVSNRYSGVTIKVLESKYFFLDAAGSDTSFLAKGTKTASVVTKVISMTGCPHAKALSYVSTALGIIGDRLAEDITLESYLGVAQYIRTSSYKASNSSTFKPTNISEEKTDSFSVMINYTEATENTTDYADITHLVDGPLTDYLVSEEVFSENSIIIATYDYYKRH